MALIVSAWLALGILNLALLESGWPLDTPKWFPISIFYGPTLNSSGIPYLCCFLAVIVSARRFASKLDVYGVWLVGAALIVLGNLGQGDWDTAFRKPFYAGHIQIQYYHDAIKIDSWSEWLESFNASQPALLEHTRTHPPFAVLIHYLLLQASGNSIAFLGIMFTLASSLSIVLVWHIFKTLDVPLERRNLLSILFSVIPAVNIYSAVCLDGLVLTSATLFLLGILCILKLGKISFWGLTSVVSGFVITNMLTYGGLFLVGVASVQALREFMVSRRFKIALSLIISIGVMATISTAIFLIYGYDHVQGFLTASALENPDGFQGVQMPVQYLATRVEGVCEIGLFLSVGFLAMLFHPDRLGFSWSDWRSTSVGLMLSGLVILFAMLASGAFRTGETARAALFIYPYVMLSLANADATVLRAILTAAGLQTVAMQLIGVYFW